MLRFLADMGISQRVVNWLRGQGYDATHLRDEGLHRLPNGNIFLKAVAESRVVLTFDLDFGEIVAASSGQLASVILFRLNNTTSEFVIRRLTVVLANATEALKRGAIIVVEDGRFRVRRFPIQR